MQVSTSILRPLALLALLFASCSRVSERPMTPARLRQAFERAPVIEVQVADGPGRGSDHLEAAWCAAEVLAQRSGKQVVVLEHVDGGSMDVPRIVIGAYTDPGVAQAAGALAPGEMQGTLEGAGLRISGEDPERPGQPIAVHTGGDWSTLLAGLENLAPALDFATSHVSAEGGRVDARARELLEGTPQRVQTDLLGPKSPRWKQRIEGGRVSLRLTKAVDVERATLYHAAALRVLEHVESWYGAPLEDSIELRVVGWTSQFRAICGRADWSGLVDLPNTRLVLLAPGLPGDDAACVARWASVRLLGPTELNWLLDGAALDASNRWWGQDLVAWGQWLAARDLLPPAAQLVDSASVDHLSQHQLAPARGLFFRYLRSEHESAFLRGLWQGREELHVNDALDASFRAWLMAQAAGAAIESRAARPSTAFDVGVAVTSDASPGGGFDGDFFHMSLARARGEGVGGLSITSYFTERPALDAVRVPRGRECMEGDVAVAQAVAAAHQAGLERVTLQTHLLLTPSAGYSAWQRRTNIEHWRGFFDELDPALVHYGLLAQLSGVDLLCIGTRLSSSKANGNLDPEVKAYHDERWSSAIELARAAFTGELTYAADWRGEAQHFAHWDKLDYVGVSIFPRWKSPPKHDKALRKKQLALLGALDLLSASAGKPVMVLETGARSTTGGLLHGRVGSGELDLLPQERYWASLADALQTRRAAGKSTSATLAGIYALSWGPSPGSGGSQDRSFNVQGKPAAQQLFRLLPLD